jgi:DNA helicase-2/ATP-dependent DNA helicase PcrA
VVAHNGSRLGKELHAERGAGKVPSLVFLPDQDAEAAFCAEIIENSMKVAGNGKARSLYSDWAVLYRTNAQSLGFETEFLRRRIPYRVVGSLKFYEREEIKDVLALLSFLVNPRDEIAFRRVVNKPARGVGAATVDRIAGTAVLDPDAGGNLEAAARCILPDMTAKARAGVTAFLAAIEGSRKLLNMEILPLPDDGDGITNYDTTLPEGKTETAAAKSPKEKKPRQTKKQNGLSAGEGLSACVAKLVENSGIAEYHLSHDDISGNQRIGNLQELINAASLYPASLQGLLSFLEHIELDRSIEESKEDEGEQGKVTLITLHNTKGLEFHRVIMTGIEQGVFPRDDKQGEDLEEERRLFYVGATRAMDELYLCSCAIRRMFGRTMPMTPSLFLSEADQSELRIIGKVPWGFAGGMWKASQSAGEESPGLPGAKASSDGRWKQGDRVFHDDHGYGTVSKIRESDDGPVISVRFETGGETHFLSLHQSSRFLKLGNDE